MEKLTCNTCANNVKRIAGWTFAHMFNFYFGEATVIFKGEGDSAEDIELVITNKWLENNQAIKFGVDLELATQSYEHVCQCSGVECIKMKSRFDKVGPFFAKGKIPGGAAIAIVSVCQSKQTGSKVVFSRDNGFGKSMDELLPFVKWFTEDRSFWDWA